MQCTRAVYKLHMTRMCPFDAVGQAACGPLAKREVTHAAGDLTWLLGATHNGQ